MRRATTGGSAANALTFKIGNFVVVEGGDKVVAVASRGSDDDDKALVDAGNDGDGDADNGNVDDDDNDDNDDDDGLVLLIKDDDPNSSRLLVNDDEAMSVELVGRSAIEVGCSSATVRRNALACM
jgi:hypothetical protein